MDYSIPIPIRKHLEYKGEFECICKRCKKAPKLWNICSLCRKKVWFSDETCNLYSTTYFSKNDHMICFYCRIQYYEQGMSNGEIRHFFRDFD